MPRPMPLKHATETLLVALLAVMIVLTGVVAALLPPLSVAAWPWVLAALLAGAYPVVLYPLLQSRRADMTFRWLHMVPVLLLLGWLIMDVLSGFVSVVSTLQQWLTAAWSLGPVLVSLAWVWVYCMQVVRRRVRRSMIVGALALLTTVSGIASYTQGWQRDLALALWDRQGMIVQNQTDWRAALRAGILEPAEPVSVVASRNGAVWAGMLRVAPPPAAPPPPHLPTSGGEVGWLIVSLIGAYSATVHRSLVRRLRM